MTTVLAAAIVGCAMTLLTHGIAAAQFNCGDTIPAKAKVTFTTDLGPCATSDGAAALTIESGAKVDLAGHTITCDEGDRPHGVQVNGKGVKLSNGTIVSCDRGLVLGGDGKHKVTAVALDDSADHGVLATGAGGNKLTRVDVHGGAGTGFQITSLKNSLKDTSSTDNGLSGYDVTGNRNKISRCVGTGNADRGIILTGNQVKLDTCVFAANGDGDSDDDGVSSNGDDNRIKNVRAVSNFGHGIQLTGSAMNNKVTKVVALDNLGEDLADDNASCGSNSWKKNVFGPSDADGVANPACIE